MLTHYFHDLDTLVNLFLGVKIFIGLAPAVNYECSKRKWQQYLNVLVEVIHDAGGVGRQEEGSLESKI